MTAYLRFSDNGQCIEYIFKSGNKKWDEYNDEQFADTPLNDTLKWDKDETNHKTVTYQNQSLGDNRK